MHLLGQDIYASQPARTTPGPAEQGAIHPETRFVLVGMGGLGCPVALNLLAAGAERFVLIDDDRVDSSNLQRQVLYTVGDVGAPKTLAARHQLRRRAPFVQVETLGTRLELDAVSDLVSELGEHDVIVECSDSPELKFAFNDAVVAPSQGGAPARRGATRLVIGGVVGWSGQLLSIDASAGDVGASDVSAGRQDHACYRCIYESPPQGAASCAGAGVMGAAAGHIGALMAQHAWSLASAQPSERSEAIVGKLFHVDFRTFESRILAPNRREGCPACHPGEARASA